MIYPNISWIIHWVWITHNAYSRTERTWLWYPVTWGEGDGWSSGQESPKSRPRSWTAPRRVQSPPRSPQTAASSEWLWTRERKLCLRCDSFVIEAETYISRLGFVWCFCCRTNTRKTGRENWKYLLNHWTPLPLSLPPHFNEKERIVQAAYSTLIQFSSGSTAQPPAMPTTSPTHQWLVGVAAPSKEVWGTHFIRGGDTKHFEKSREQTLFRVYNPGVLC